MYYHGVEKYVDEFIKNFDEHYSIILNEDVPILERPSTRIGGTLTDSRLHDKDFWKKQLGILEEAIEMIKSLDCEECEKIALRKKILEIRLTPMYMLGIKYDEYYFDDESGKKAHWESFFQDCEELGYVYYREGGKLERLKNLVFG